MKIKKMTATFGKLEQATLTPGEGLTVIYAPNEGGKSTWAGFLKAMLYGIETKERDKGGFLADKSRYRPWSGVPMWGELQLDWEGRDITLRRTTNRSGPMQAFEAVYTASGDPVPELTGANAGQTITGVGREAFLRSALVGQNSTAITHTAELESRIAALATSGQEDVSYSATERVLKDWKNRRRANRANGQIPELEKKLVQVEGRLDELKQARDRKAQAENRLNQLEEERRGLNSDLEIHRRLAQKELNRRYGQALEAVSAARMKLEELPDPDTVYAGLSAKQAREKAGRLEEQAEEQREARRRQQEQMRQAEELRRRRARVSKWGKGIMALFGIAGLALTVLGFVLGKSAMTYGGFGCLALAGVAAVVSGAFPPGAKRRSEAGEETAPIPEPEPFPPVEDYLQLLAQKERLEQEVRHCRERAEDLKAQGAREFDTLELLHTPACSAAETAARLQMVEREIARWQTQRDQAIGALGTDPGELEAKRDKLLAELKERTLEFDALDLALKGLEQANAVLRERFSPALNQEAAAIFDRLTGGRYSRLSLDRNFSALAGTEDAAQPHSALYLSAGTVDQLYLAVRLAVCRLTLPGVPVLLDDALTAFDDGRMARALDCLKELGAERQILLFTCHSREIRWAEENGVPVIHM